MLGARADLVLRVLDLGVRPGDSEEMLLRKRLLTAGGLLVPVALATLGIVYLHYGETVAGVGYCGFAAWLWLQVGLFAWHGNVRTAAVAVAAVALPAHLLAIVSLGNLIHSGGLLLWGLAFPVATGSIFLPLTWMYPFYAMYAVNVAVQVFVATGDRSNVPTGMERAILFANLLGMSAFAVVIIVTFVIQRDRAFRLLSEEQQRTRDLLLNILPREIADELSENPGVIAEHREAVSILFCDVVSFTPLAESMAPGEVVEMLDSLVSAFDELVEKYDLEKIKTIGDCYMAAAGIPRERPDHARALVALALDMQRLVCEREFGGRRLQVRIGINSGPVVAGVIGRRKFSYDLWGDAVNTASRMESHGVAGEVRVTKATYELIGDAFECTPVGTIDVKGKGALPVWSVAAAR